MAGLRTDDHLSDLPDKVCTALELVIAVAISKNRATTPGAPPRSGDSKEERAIAAARLAAGKKSGMTVELLTACWEAGDSYTIRSIGTRSTTTSSSSKVAAWRN